MYEQPKIHQAMANDCVRNETDVDQTEIRPNPTVCRLSCSERVRPGSWRFRRRIRRVGLRQDSETALGLTRVTNTISSRRPKAQHTTSLRRKERRVDTVVLLSRLNPVAVSLASYESRSVPNDKTTNSALRQKAKRA